MSSLRESGAAGTDCLRLERSVVIYDGDCRVCCAAIDWLRQRHGHELEFLPLQSPKAARLGIPPERLHRSIHLVERDGAIFHGAAAALRLLARDPRHSRWLRWYEQDATFAEVSEAAYAFIAQHRYILSWLLPRGGPG